MNKPQGYDEAQAYTGDFEALKLGGHICKIIDAVEGITIPYCAQITGVIAAVNGVISTYLLGQKAISEKEEK